MLSAADAALIEAGTFPQEERPDLVFPVDGDSLVLTVRGIRFFNAFAKRWGVAANVGQLASKSDLRNFKVRCLLQVLAARQAQSADDLRRGTVPINERAMTHALVYGSMEEIANECKRFADCKQAGENVVPVAFGLVSSRHEAAAG